MTKFIFVAGGVISGVGKGVTVASLGKIMKEYGYKTTLIKVDPYINYDAGTLRPTEHGEVWVTVDGGEIDQDLGTYERFLGEDIPKKNSITTGQVYKTVIDRERRGGYLGQTVQLVPHIVGEIKERIVEASAGYDIAIIELGGIVGDYENAPFMFAIKSLERDLGADSVAYILVSYLPVPYHIQEMKTKPTQQAIRAMAQEGLYPDFIICRSANGLDEIRKQKIEVFAHIRAGHVISAPDLETIYQMPLHLEREGLSAKLLAHLKLEPKKVPQWAAWEDQVRAIVAPKQTIKIAIIGKYLEHGDYNVIDSYTSINHALTHAGSSMNVGVEVSWINAVTFEHDPAQLQTLRSFDGILVPGGFGHGGVEGKIAAIEYARKHKVPYLGICYGMQLAVVEFARHVAGMAGAHTTEVNEQTLYPVIDLIHDQREHMQENNLGGTMRLGSYNAAVQRDTKVAALYQAHAKSHEEGDMLIVSERHRHRYEVNPLFVDSISNAGLTFSGSYTREDGTQLMEFIEIADHPFFVATQAHPEFNSRMGNPNPLFHGFVQACMERGTLNVQPLKNYVEGLYPAEHVKDGSLDHYV